MQTKTVQPVIVELVYKSVVITVRCACITTDPNVH